MAGPLLAFAPLIALIITLFAVAAVWPRRRRLARANEARHRQLAQAVGRIQLLRTLSLVVGLLVAIFMSGLGNLGIGMALVPATFGLIQIVGVLVAEQVTRPVARTPGVAGLETRTVGSYLPRTLSWLVASTVVLTIAYLAWSTTVAGADAIGNVGRNFTITSTDGTVSLSFGPFPGSYYTGPVAGALLLLTAMAATALLAIRNRPRDGSQPDLVAADDILRIRASESVIAGLGIGFAGTLAGAASVVTMPALANSRTADGSPVEGSQQVLSLMGWVSLGIAIAALAVTLWCLAVLLMPGAAAEPAPVEEGLAPGSSAGERLMSGSSAEVTWPEPPAAASAHPASPPRGEPSAGGNPHDG